MNLVVDDREFLVRIFLSPVLVCLLFYLCGGCCAVGRVWSRRLGQHPDRVPTGDSERRRCPGKRLRHHPLGGGATWRPQPAPAPPLPSLPPPPPPPSLSLLARPALLLSRPQLPFASLLPSQALTSVCRRNDCAFSGSENSRAVLQGDVPYKWVSLGSLGS